ncbi:unnamed protein product [Echinostoma caproni]|uniref:RWD domain-containing protein n=1 Tax=Echinostoma caproni TaxID=27848 RepID=A0A183AWY5_9TREM|nr:unnamed protein product [Echinostoma caproni]
MSQRAAIDAQREELFVLLSMFPELIVSANGLAQPVNCIDSLQAITDDVYPLRLGICLRPNIRQPTKSHTLNKRVTRSVVLNVVCDLNYPQTPPSLHFKEAKRIPQDVLNELDHRLQDVLISNKNQLEWERKAESDSQLAKIFETVGGGDSESLDPNSVPVTPSPPVCPLTRHTRLCPLNVKRLLPRAQLTSQSGSTETNILCVQRGACLDGPHEKPIRTPSKPNTTKPHIFPCRARFDGFTCDTGQPLRIDEWLIPSRRGPKSSDCRDTAKLLESLAPQLVYLTRCSKPPELCRVLGYQYISNGSPSGESMRPGSGGGSADYSGWFVAQLVSERPRGTCLTTLVNVLTDRTGETTRSFAWIRTVTQQLVDVLIWLHGQNMSHRDLQVSSSRIDFLFVPRCVCVCVCKLNPSIRYTVRTVISLYIVII